LFNNHQLNAGGFILGLQTELDGYSANNKLFPLSIF